MTKRIWILIAIAGAMAVMVEGAGATPSGPKPRTGTFKGKTTQGLPISFVVAHSRVKGGAREGYFWIKSASIRVRFTCVDGTAPLHTVKLTAARTAPNPTAPKGGVAGISWGPGTTFSYRGRVASPPYKRLGVRWEGWFTSPKRASGGKSGLNISVLADSGSDRTCETKDFGWNASWKKK